MCFQLPSRRRSEVRSPSSGALPLKAHLLVNNNDDDGHNETGQTTMISRRRLFGRAAASVAASSVFARNPTIVSAAVVGKPDTASTISIASSERDTLLKAISSSQSDEDILKAIQQIIPLSPLKPNSLNAKASYATALDGEWKLLWYNFSDFSPLLKLPPPLRPDSYQYFGTIAEKEVGAGRVAQGLTGGVLNTFGANKELWLSSGAVANDENSSILEIFPPFRFQYGSMPGSLKRKRTIVESQSDSEFRAANARTKEAQLAPKNEYEQLYVEDIGKGSLRISTVVRGDPVIVGEMFVHQKL